MGTELRALKIEEIRSTGGDAPVVEGYGVVYDQEIELFPGFFEKIHRGAFTGSLAKRETVKSYFNHDSHKVLSTTRSNPPLTLQEDEKGIYYKSPIPPTTYGKDLEVNLERNNVEGSSFAFSVDNEVWEERNDGTIHREIRVAQIYEIGPVTDPAYIQTGAALHSAKDTFEKRMKVNQTEIDNLKIVNDTKNKSILDYEMRKLNLEKEII